MELNRKNIDYLKEYINHSSATRCFHGSFESCDACNGKDNQCKKWLLEILDDYSKLIKIDCFPYNQERIDNETA